MQSDPIGVEGGVNLYAYVGNDPVDSIDPLGTRDCGLESNWKHGDCARWQVQYQFRQIGQAAGWSDAVIGSLMGGALAYARGEISLSGFASAIDMALNPLGVNLAATKAGKGIYVLDPPTKAEQQILDALFSSPTMKGRLADVWQRQ